MLLLLNICLYLFAFAYSFKIFKAGNRSLFGLVLWSAYLLTAVMCLINYNRDPSEWQLSLFPFLYLFLIVFIWICPFNGISFGSLRMGHSKIYIAFIYIMIVCGIINIYYSFGVSWTNYLTDSWADAYAGGEEAANAVNLLDWLAKNINSYGSIPLSIICFYYLSRENSKYNTLCITALLIVFVAVFLETAMTAGRGATLAAIAQLFSGSPFFFDAFSKKQKKTFIIVLLVGGSVYLAYNFLIAEARYGLSYEGGGEESMIYYMGHSMLTFDYGIADTIKKYAWGDFIFHLHSNLYNAGFDTVLGTHAMKRFTTYVGSLYFDFGPWVTLIISIVISSIMMQKRKVRDIADAFIICFYFRFLFMGVFVYGRGYYILWLMAGIEYFLLKFLVKQNVL